MRKLNASSPPISPREREVLTLFRQGIPKPEIAKKMGLKGAGSVSAYLSMLRRKGALEPLPEGTKGRRITEPGPPPSRDSSFAALKDESGLAIQQVMKNEPKDEPIEVPVRRRARPERTVSMTAYQLAKLVDDAIHEHIRNGGRLDAIHRSAVVLVGEILKPS